MRGQRGERLREGLLGGAWMDGLGQRCDATSVGMSYVSMSYVRMRVTQLGLVCVASGCQGMRQHAEGRDAIGCHERQ